MVNSRDDNCTNKGPDPIAVSAQGSTDQPARLAIRVLVLSRPLVTRTANSGRDYRTTTAFLSATPVEDR